jgi:arylsulfatase A-like enzyme
MRRQGTLSERRIDPSRRFAIPIFTALALAGTLVVMGSGTSPLKEATAAPRPNIVVIYSDDQTLESMRVMDNVNSLIGDQGATFNKFFTNYALCCPSRATFLTGQYMHNHQVMGNQAPDGGFTRFQALHGNNNLATWLRGSGYYTAMVGKYMNNYANQPRVPKGWSEWRVGAPYEQRVYNYPMNENGTIVNYGQNPADFKQDVLTRKAVGVIDRRAPKAQPFFLWLNYTAPHVGGPPNPNPPANCREAAKPAPRHSHAFDTEPLPQPPNFNEPNVSDKPAQIRNRPLLSAAQITDIQRKYRCELESLLSIDEGVESIVDELAAKGELANTLIAYTSDNGYYHGEHRIPADKMQLYEESIRVPLLMRGPGIPAGVDVGTLTINADLAPTVVDAANANPGLVMDGRSLLPVARHPNIESGRLLLIEQPNFKAIRTERYLYAEHSGGARELYDLNNDPFELVSRHTASAYATARQNLASRLDQLRNCAGSGCRLHNTP